MAVQLVVLALGRVHPFGWASMGLGDFGTQYLPFHALLRSALLGSPLTGPLFTWQLGGGAQTLPDYATYTASPLAPLVTLLPAARVELAVTAIAVAKLGLAAATMAWLLCELRPELAARGHRVVLVALAVSHAASSWVPNIGFYTVQWLDSLYTFPLLCLSGLWARQRRRPGLAVAVAALAWWANFYTAYMATIGAGLLLVALLLAMPSGWRQDLAALLRFCLTTVVGIGCAGVILVPTAMALEVSTKTGGPTLGGLEWRDILVRLFSHTEGVRQTPSLSAGAMALVVLLGLPLASHLTRRARLVLAAASVLLVLGLDSRPVLLVWNAFDLPNGNPYRFSFTLCGWIVCLAALAWPLSPLGWRRRLPSVLLSGVLLAVLVWATRGAPGAFNHTDPWGPRWAALAWLLLVPVLLAGTSTIRRVTTWLLLSVVLVEAVTSGVFVNRSLHGFLTETPQTSGWAHRAQQQGQLYTQAAPWPVHRVGVPQDLTQLNWLPNDAALDGYPATSYYSTLTAAATTSAWIGLGAGIRFEGRRLYEDSDPVWDAITAVSVRPASRTGRPASRPDPKPAMPMVRLAAEHPRTHLGPVFDNRNDLFSAPVYSAPSRVSFTLDGHSQALGSPVALPAPSRGELVVECLPGQRPTVMLAGVSGRLRGDGSPVRLGEVNLHPAGTVGSARLVLDSYRPGRLVAQPAACLDENLVARQVAATEVPRITITPGRVSATFAAPVTGRVVVAAPAIDGWQVLVDGRPARVRPVAGLLAVDASGATSVQFVHRVPGLLAGALVSGASLLAALTLVLLDRRCRSR